MVMRVSVLPVNIRMRKARPDVDTAIQPLDCAQSRGWTAELKDFFNPADQKFPALLLDGL
jgi:hypothetical protein